MIRLVSLLRLAGLAAVAALPLTAANTPPEIRNLKVQQRPGTYLVDVTFDLVDPDSSAGVFVSLEASADNGLSYSIPVRTYSGDIDLVKPGQGKKIEWNARKDWPENYTTNAKVRLVVADTIPQGPNGIAPEDFRWIPSGQFLMGAKPSSPYYTGYELQFLAEITDGFWMCDHEVTQEEYLRLMNKNPSNFIGSQRPVENVSWYDANEYCEVLTRVERLAGRINDAWQYSLPTEAQWEYAARGGVETVYGDTLEEIQRQAAVSFGMTQPVRSFRPNPWGLYEMNMNVAEWCLDWFYEYPSALTVAANPEGPMLGVEKMVRGARFNDIKPISFRLGRGWGNPNTMRNDYGFRVVLKKSVR